jgi:hypothetical protein
VGDGGKGGGAALVKNADDKISPDEATQLSAEKDILSRTLTRNGHCRAEH